MTDNLEFNWYFGQPKRVKELHEFDWGTIRDNKLNGYEVKKGEYEIQWPDGSNTFEDVLIEERRGIYTDMGVQYDIYEHFAYVHNSHRGLNIKIYLEGLVARKIKR